MNRDQREWKKTCAYEKRLTRMKRDLSKRPTHRKGGLYKWTETNATPEGPVHMKRDLHEWKETDTYEKKLLKGTYGVATTSRLLQIIGLFCKI